MVINATSNNSDSENDEDSESQRKTLNITLLSNVIITNNYGQFVEFV